MIQAITFRENQKKVDQSLKWPQRIADAVKMSRKAIGKSSPCSFSILLKGFQTFAKSHKRPLFFEIVFTLPDTLYNQDISKII